MLSFCFLLFCVSEHYAAMHSRACGEARAQSVTMLYFLHCLLPFFNVLTYCWLFQRATVHLIVYEP